MAKIQGYEEISKQLSAMGRAVGGSALRASAMAAMLPALQAARRAIPRADPPYHEGSGIKGGVYQSKGTIRTVDPYPKKTYLGRLVTPGFASRNVGRKSWLSKDGTVVKAMLGVAKEAFYVINFIELGTRFIPKHPWLEPSFRSSIPEVDLRFQQQLRYRIDQAAAHGIDQGGFGFDAWLSDEASEYIEQ